MNLTPSTHEDTENSWKTYRRRQYKQHKTQKKTTHKNFKPKQNNSKQQYTMNNQPPENNEQNYPNIQNTTDQNRAATSHQPHTANTKCHRKHYKLERQRPTKRVHTTAKHQANQNIYRRITHNTRNTIVTRTYQRTRNISNTHNTGTRRIPCFTIPSNKQ